MFKKRNIHLMRAFTLICVAIILLAARIHPLTQPGYKIFCITTKRAQVTYLTNICAVMSILMFSFGACLSLRTIFLKSDAERGIIQIAYMRVISDFLSVNLTMAMGYWYLYFYNRKLLRGYEKSNDFRMNTLLSHLDHTLPPIFNLLEAYLMKGDFIFHSFFTSLIIGVLYFILIARFHYYKEVWPYELFRGKSYTEVLLIMIVYIMIGTMTSFSFLFMFNKIRSFLKARSKNLISSKRPSEYSIISLE